MPHVFTHIEICRHGICLRFFFNGNALVACRDLCERFPTRRPPDSRVFTGVYDKLHDTGAFLSRHNSSESVDEQNVDQIENILQSVEHTQPCIKHKIFREGIGVLHTIWRTLRRHGLHPSHLLWVQNLHARDETKRLEFCRWYLLIAD